MLETAFGSPQGERDDVVFDVARASTDRSARRRAGMPLLKFVLDLQRPMFVRRSGGSAPGNDSRNRGPILVARLIGLRLRGRRAHRPTAGVPASADIRHSRVPARESPWPRRVRAGRCEKLDGASQPGSGASTRGGPSRPTSRFPARWCAGYRARAGLPPGAVAAPGGAHGGPVAERTRRDWLMILCLGHEPRPDR
jgi:hypothetical protein